MAGFGRAMTSLRHAWAALPAALEMLEPLPLSEEAWSVIERLRDSFGDRSAHARLPLPIARFRDAAVRAIFEYASRLEDVETETVDERWQRAKFIDGPADVMALHARRFNDEVDRLVRVLVPSARYRKGHYAYGRFTVPSPHGLHTDHSAEDPASAAEPICIARIETLGTHYVAGDAAAYDEATRRKLEALRYWTTIPEGEPEALFEELLRRQVLRTIPVNHVVMMVAGNNSPTAQATQHIAARPPAGGIPSAFFQRQYRLVPLSAS